MLDSANLNQTKVAVGRAIRLSQPLWAGIEESSQKPFRKWTLALSGANRCRLSKSASIQSVLCLGFCVMLFWLLIPCLHTHTHKFHDHIIMHVQNHAAAYVYTHRQLLINCMTFSLTTLMSSPGGGKKGQGRMNGKKERTISVSAHLEPLSSISHSACARSCAVSRTTVGRNLTFSVRESLFCACVCV